MPCVHIITTPKLLLFFCFCSPPPIFFPPFFPKIFFPSPPPRDRGGGGVIKGRPVAIGEGGVAMSDALSKAALFGWLLRLCRGLVVCRRSVSDPPTPTAFFCSFVYCCFNCRHWILFDEALKHVVCVHNSK